MPNMQLLDQSVLHAHSRYLPINMNAQCKVMDFSTTLCLCLPYTAEYHMEMAKGFLTFS